MRILVISPSFFGYEKQIITAFEKQGCHVNFLDERPRNTPITKAAVRVFPQMLSRQIQQHFQTALKRFTDSRFDAVLVIKGEVTPKWFLRELREKNRDAAFIYYTFDSLRNSPQGKRILDMFNFKFSFDRSDVEANESFVYKPLFYGPDYDLSSGDRDLDVSFVGTLHGDRYRLTQNLASKVERRSRLLFYYMAARWYFWVRKLTSRDLKGVRLSEVSFESLTSSEAATAVKRSKAVIDVQRAGQTGLTMRTFEVLATGAGLITTNKAITMEPFYTEDRVLIVGRSPDPNEANRVRRFIDSQPSSPTGIDGFQRYSLDNWVQEFVNLLQKDESR